MEKTKGLLSKIGKSPYISTVQKMVKVEPGRVFSCGDVQGRDKEKVEVEVEVEVKVEMVEKPKAQNKAFSLFEGKSAAKDIFTQLPQTSQKVPSLFDSKQTTIFGQPSLSKQTGNSLFDKKP